MDLEQVESFAGPLPAVTFVAFRPDEFLSYKTLEGSSLVSPKSSEMSKTMAPFLWKRLSWPPGLAKNLNPPYE
jgi:hypothetical protein